MPRAEVPLALIALLPFLSILSHVCASCRRMQHGCMPYLVCAPLGVAVVGNRIARTGLFSLQKESMLGPGGRGYYSDYNTLLESRKMLTEDAANAEEDVGHQKASTLAREIEQSLLHTTSGCQLAAL